MKSQALQELVSRIFKDEDSRAQFISDPDSVMSQFSLTEQERAAVLTTHSRLGVVNSGSPQLAAAIGPMASWF